MVNASLVVRVGEYLGNVVGAEFIFTCFPNHANRGQVSQYPSFGHSQPRQSSWVQGTITQKFWCCTRLCSECAHTYGAFTTGKSIEEGEIDAETGTSNLKVLCSKILDNTTPHKVISWQHTNQAR